VQDVARLHVAGLIDPTTNRERIFAFAAPYSINEFFDIFARFVPGYQARDALAGLEAETLLKKLGRVGFAGLEETVIDSVQTRINVSS
jgi:hypothetical protein